MSVLRSEKVRNPLTRLASIKQGPSDTLKMYVKRFNEGLVTIHNPQEHGVLMASISGVQLETPFWDKLQKDECKTLQEFYRRADKIMPLETTREVVHAGRSTLEEAPRDIAPIGKFKSADKNGDNKKHKSGDR